VTIEDNFRNIPNLCRIQYRTLSTGEIHPLAGSIAAVEYTLGIGSGHLPEPNLWGYSIRICGDHVAILFMGYHLWGRNELGMSELVVWNWRTGVQKLMVLSANLRSFTFLGDNYILGSTSAPPALLVYSLNQ